MTILLLVLILLAVMGALNFSNLFWVIVLILVVMLALGGLRA